MHLTDYLLLLVATAAGLAAAFGGVMLTLTPPHRKAARAAFWVAGFCFAVLGVIWALQAPTYPLATRIGVAAVTAAIAAAALVYILSLIIDTPIKPDGVLLPASSEIPPASDLPPGAMAVELGGAGVAMATIFPHTIIKMGGDDMLAIDRDKNNGNVIISALQIYDDRKDIIAAVNSDHSIWVKAGSRKETPDDSTLVVYDHYNHQVLRIKYLNPRAFFVEGIFQHHARNDVVELAKDYVRINAIKIKQFMAMDNGADIVIP